MSIVDKFCTLLSITDTIFDSNSKKWNFFHFGVEPEAEKRPRALQGEDPPHPLDLLDLMDPLYPMDLTDLTDPKHSGSRVMPVARATVTTGHWDISAVAAQHMHTSVGGMHLHGTILFMWATWCRKCTR